MGGVVQLITLSTPTRVEVELGWGCGLAVTISHRCNYTLLGYIRQGQKNWTPYMCKQEYVSACKGILFLFNILIFQGRYAPLIPAPTEGLPPHACKGSENIYWPYFAEGSYYIAQWVVWSEKEWISRGGIKLCQGLCTIFCGSFFI